MFSAQLALYTIPAEKLLDFSGCSWALPPVNVVIWVFACWKLFGTPCARHACASGVLTPGNTTGEPVGPQGSTRVAAKFVRPKSSPRFGARKPVEYVPRSARSWVGCHLSPPLKVVVLPKFE